jgi:hypothetical protein
VGLAVILESPPGIVGFYALICNAPPRQPDAGRRHADENRIPTKGHRHAGKNRHPVKSSGFRPRIKAFRGMLTDAGMTV